MNKFEKTKIFFDTLSKDNIFAVDEFYDKEISFIDPLVTLVGIDNLRSYYSKLYGAVISISFDLSANVSEGESLFITWIMHLRATGIKKGEEIHLAGCSHIKFNQNLKAVYHRDYYDMGEFVYEHVPILNKVIFYIKNLLRKH